jgi:hypothetical protein
MAAEGAGLRPSLEVATAFPPLSEKAEASNLRRPVLKLQHANAPNMVTRLNLENFIWIIANDMIEGDVLVLSLGVDVAVE